jgi:hypothetical protein
MSRGRSSWSSLSSEIELRNRLRTYWSPCKHCIVLPMQLRNVANSFLNDSCYYGYSINLHHVTMDLSDVIDAPLSCCRGVASDKLTSGGNVTTEHFRGLIGQAR